MTRKQEYFFRGDSKYRPEKHYPQSPREPEPYICSEELAAVVNLAIFLRRPLLLEGEAGCGKTRLAKAVAYELGLPFYPWYVHSTSKAQEGLYSYDYILRLHDVQVNQIQKESSTRDPKNPMAYRKFGALGDAFRSTDCPAILLIDEIDKADVDFPNDLLSVLDQWEFNIPETGESIKVSQDNLPIIFITSNKEKGNLPDPFLRRCIYHYIKFPSEKDILCRIIQAHDLDGKGKAEKETVQAAINRFLMIREDTGLHKRPGTS